MSWTELLGGSDLSGRRRPLLLGAALLLVACAFMLASAASASAEGSISGTVTDSATGDFVEEVEVCAYPPEEFSLEDCDFTDSLGEYTIPELENGSYVVEFWGFEFGYITQYWDGKSSEEEADPVTVNDNAVTGIDAALEKEAPLPPPPPPPPAVTPVVVPPPPPVVVPKGKAKAKGKKCKKGFRPKKVRGKKRCVKIKKHRRKRRHG